MDSVERLCWKASDTSKSSTVSISCSVCMVASKVFLTCTDGETQKLTNQASYVTQSWSYLSFLASLDDDLGLYWNDTKQHLNVRPERHQTKTWKWRVSGKETKLYVKLLKEAFCSGLRLIKLISSNDMARPLSSRAQETGRQRENREQAEPLAQESLTGPGYYHLHLHLCVCGS